MGKLLPLRRVQGEVAELSDDSLLAACALGDNAALGALFDRFHKPLFRFLLRNFNRHAVDLEDLVQATFLSVPQAAAKFRKEASVRAWLFSIALNLARHHVRAEGRRRNMLDGFARQGDAEAAQPDDLAAQKELLSRLEGAIHELPEELRVVFVMCGLEEVPGVEVARLLGLREGTVWRRLHEARCALRQALERKSP